MCHLALKHTAAAHHLVFMFEHLKENLRRNIVGIITDNHHFAIAEGLLQVEFKEIGSHNSVVQLIGICGFQVVHALRVEFHHGKVVVCLEQKLGEHTHTRSHLQHRCTPVFAHRVGNALCHS